MSNSPHAVRDMGRAAWQRGEGMVFFTQLADLAFHSSEVSLPDAEIENILLQEDSRLMGYTGLLDVPDVVRHAYKISDELFSQPNNPETDFALSQLPAEQVANLSHHTFFRTAPKAFGQSIPTAARFPLNIACTMATIAEKNNIPGYDATSLAGIAGILRRDDSRAMVHAAALTRNGKLGHRIDSIIPDMNQEMASPVVLFKPDTLEMQFAESYKERLLQALKKVNKAGVSSADTAIVSRTSSGCPVAHLRPQLTSSESDNRSLDSLSKHFSVPVDELTKQRERTGIDVGIDYLAEALDRAHLIQLRLASTALVAA